MWRNEKTLKANIGIKMISKDGKYVFMTQVMTILWTKISQKCQNRPFLTDNTRLTIFQYSIEKCWNYSMQLVLKQFKAKYNCTCNFNTHILCYLPVNPKTKYLCKYLNILERESCFLSLLLSFCNFSFLVNLHLMLGIF